MAHATDGFESGMHSRRGWDCWQLRDDLPPVRFGQAVISSINERGGCSTLVQGMGAPKSKWVDGTGTKMV